MKNQSFSVVKNGMAVHNLASEEILAYVFQQYKAFYWMLKN